VFANRYWPVRLTTKTQDIVYGATTWQELDAAVTQTAAGTIERAYALMDAHRVHEAYTETKRLTDEHADDISAWYLRYQLALRVGAVEDIGVCNEFIASLERQ
jgi:hypothetical protein